MILADRNERPRRRTIELVKDEIELVRRRRDRRLAAGELRLAGEDCLDLEQLTREHSAFLLSEK